MGPSRESPRPNAKETGSGVLTTPTGGAADDRREPAAVFNPQAPAVTELAEGAFIARAVKVAREITEICLRNTPDTVTSDGVLLDYFPNIKANQIEPNGALIFHINFNPYTALKFNVELWTPIGAIACFKSNSAISAATLNEIAERFGLSQPDAGLHPGKFLVGRDFFGVPFAQEWEETTPGRYRDSTECLRLWAVAQDLIKVS